MRGYRLSRDYCIRYRIESGELGQDDLDTAEALVGRANDRFRVIYHETSRAAALLVSAHRNS